jgi:hypothetical protein
MMKSLRKKKSPRRKTRKQPKSKRKRKRRKKRKTRKKTKRRKRRRTPVTAKKNQMMNDLCFLFNSHKVINHYLSSLNTS